MKDDIIKFSRLFKEREASAIVIDERCYQQKRHFFEMNDITLPWIQISKFIGEIDLSILARHPLFDIDTGYTAVQCIQLHFIKVMIAYT